LFLALTKKTLSAFRYAKRTLCQSTWKCRTARLQARRAAAGQLIAHFVIERTVLVRARLVESLNANRLQGNPDTAKGRRTDRRVRGFYDRLRTSTIPRSGRARSVWRWRTTVPCSSARTETAQSGGLPKQLERRCRAEARQWRLTGIVILW